MLLSHPPPHCRFEARDCGAVDTASVSRRGDVPGSGSSLAGGSADSFEAHFFKWCPAFFVVGVSQAFGRVMMLFEATLTGA